jgi:hypothetical protein
VIIETGPVSPGAEPGGTERRPSLLISFKFTVKCVKLHWNYYYLLSGFFNSTLLEYELNRHLCCFIAQSVIPPTIGALIGFMYFLSLFGNFDHVDFMSTARFGIRVMRVLYFVF